MEVDELTTNLKVNLHFGPCQEANLNILKVFCCNVPGFSTVALSLIFFESFTSSDSVFIKLVVLHLSSIPPLSVSLHIEKGI